MKNLYFVERKILDLSVRGKWINIMIELEAAKIGFFLLKEIRKNLSFESKIRDFCVCRKWISE